jgi:hypothetical protein
MGRQFRWWLWVGLVAGPLVFPLLGGSQSKEPHISPKNIQQMRSLPFGINDQRHFILRQKDIKGVQFFDNAHEFSRYGYFNNGGIINTAAWMHLVNRGDLPTATATIHLKKPLDISNYNSVVLWVQAHQRSQRIQVGLRDPSWTEADTAKIQTVAMPKWGFGKEKIYQVVLPYRIFSNARKLDWEQLTGITVEFGSETVGNRQIGSIHVLGLAFVAQKNNMIKPMFISSTYQVASRRRSTKTKARKSPPLKSPPVKRGQKNKITANVPVAAQEKTPTTVQKNLPPSPHPQVIPSQKPFRTFLANMSQMSVWLGRILNTAAKKIIHIMPQIIIGSVLFLIAAALSLGGWFLALFLKNRWSHKRLRPTQKIMVQVFPPDKPEAPFTDLKQVKEHWKSKADNGVRLAWMSSTTVPKEKFVQDELYHGEKYLIEQIRVAKSCRVSLFPSICFVLNIFNYETFLKNPRRYFVREVPPSDQHLSDEELRIKNIGFYPVWVPPNIQTRQKLSERVLVAFGKLPGKMPLSDSIQFNLTSPILRQYAIDVLSHFAQAAKGVRIEGAAALLNSSLQRFWRVAPKEMPKTEFWDEVISGVKAKYPDFIMMADGVGADAKLIRDLGFDFFENDLLRDGLINQIRLEHVGNLVRILESGAGQLLDRSIYDITPIFRSQNKTFMAQQQNLFGCMLLSLIPGFIQHNGNLASGLRQFIEEMARIPALNYGRFSVLPTPSPFVLAFARWDAKDLYVAVANFSTRDQFVQIPLNPFRGVFVGDKIHLFNDVLHGTFGGRNVPAGNSAGPVIAAMGHDLQETGLSLNLSGLSLRLFSVNLSRPFSHEPISKIHQFR